MIPKPATERIQAFIHSMETGIVGTILKCASVCLGFVTLALFFNLTKSEGFSSQEAMESAHLARQLAEGQGYTTDSIRPFALHLLQQADPAQASQVLRHPVPDLSVAPGYPCVLAVMMKFLPFHFTANSEQRWIYQPELWIKAINELFFLAAVLVLFQVARRLFDGVVAWLSAIIFAGTELYWKFSSAGLSTMWLILIFLLLVWCLVMLEDRERRPVPPRLGGSLLLVAAVGALTGLGALSLYSFAWMIIPVLIFLRLFFTRSRAKLGLVAVAAFLIVLGPWIARNLVLSQTCFGTAGYAWLDDTSHLQDDVLERSFEPGAALGNVTPKDVINKFVLNEREILQNDAPRLGGSWVCAFFLAGLLLPFRNPALQRFRLFLLWSLAIMAVVQALGQTHLSADVPEINTENLLVLLSPLVLIFGTGVFITLLDQIVLPDPRASRSVAGLFAAIMCAPLLLTLVGPAKVTPITPYSPWHVQKVAAMMQPDELMMSDIPWAVAWYGNRPCAWLTLNDADSFTNQLEKLKPVQAIFLTQRTSDRRFLSQMIVNQHINESDWSYFYLESLPGWGHGNVPTGFPLQKAILDYPPDQMFISDRIRWQNASKK